MIKSVSLNEIKSCNFRPEPHTVSFDADVQEWFAYVLGDKIVSVLGVSDRHGGKYISSCYTLPEYRKRGLLSMLILEVADRYKGQKIIAHCLKSSRDIFAKCGFTHYRTVEYKHGTQYFMKKEATANGENS